MSPARRPVDPLVALGLRRARAIGLAAELAEVAQRQNRPFRPAERAQYDALDEVITWLDNRIRRAQIRAKADPMAPMPRPPVPIPVDTRGPRKWDYERPGMPAPIAPYARLVPGDPSWQSTLGSLGPRR